MKKKITVVSGIVFTFCVICGAVANGFSNNIKTADYYLEQMAECQPAFNAMYDYTLEGWSNSIKKLGKDKFFYCLGAMADFHGCAGTTMDRVTQNNPALKVFCACGAFQHKRYIKLGGELAYYNLLKQNGIQIDTKKFKTLEDEWNKETAKIDFIGDMEKCSKFKYQ